MNAGESLSEMLLEAAHNRRRDQSFQDARRHCKQAATLEQEATEAVHCEVYYTLKRLVDQYESSLKIDVRDMEARQAKELAALQARHAAERKEIEANHDREWLGETKLEKVKDEHDAALRSAILTAASNETGEWSWLLSEWEQSEVARRVAEELVQQEERRREEAESATAHTQTAVDFVMAGAFGNR